MTKVRKNPLPDKPSTEKAALELGRHLVVEGDPNTKDEPGRDGCAPPKLVTAK